MKGVDVSPLRTQQSRFIPTQAGTLARWNFTFFSLACRFRGSDTLT